MSIFLDTTGLSTLAIGICDRCKFKRPLSTMGPDTNFPGLRVCDQGCKDEKDPYRLPARKTERINLRFPRPDESVATNPNAITTGAYGYNELSPEQNTQNPENSGNLDTITVSP